uniref:pseudouridylate synthase PUS7L-like n=1 Tax=Centroberyx gerrardi TaxID=166262 RepID=UPI003AAC0CA3
MELYSSCRTHSGCCSLQTRGFVNYYGPQRFGSGQSVQSDRVGLALLKEDMGSAVRLFFTPEEGDDPQSQAKRHFLQTGEFIAIHVVTGQEEQEGVCTLGQVLLPMPGNTVRYPENAVGTWYQERLARDGLENCRFRVGALKLNLPGCYRPLLAFPRNLKQQLQSSTTAGEGGGEDSDSLTLTLNFDLDTSCYATVCLREIMKCAKFLDLCHV